MNSSIFRAYDLRGVYGTDFDETDAKQIGLGFGTMIQEKYGISHPKILVGKDNRTHGTVLQDALIKGLIETGAKVHQLEDACSPMLYFGVCHGDYDAGINVTASHNPPEYNGFKLVGREAHSIAGEEIQELKTLIEKEAFIRKNSGSLQQSSIHEEYIQNIQSKIQLQRPLKVVVDAGNGIAGKYYPELFRSIGCEVIELYCEQDGSFPNHQPDPIVEANTEDLKKKVLEVSADVGFSFDGDGDRVGVVDSEGTFHDADESFYLLIEEVLKKHPESSVIYTVSNSLIIPERIQELGGKAVMVPVGHSHVEIAMHVHHAPLGGEQSGHFFVADDYFGFDDAGFTAAYLCQVFSKKSSSAECYSSIPHTFKDPEWRVPCPDDKKFQVVAAIAKELSEQYPAETMDGVRAELGDGAWIGIRASNTSPKVSVCLEAKSQEKLKEISGLAKELLAAQGLQR